MFRKNTMKIVTLPETNIAPKNGWLEYYFPSGEAYFQGRLLLVSGRAIFLLYQTYMPIFHHPFIARKKSLGIRSPSNRSSHLNESKVFKSLSEMHHEICVASITSTCKYIIYIYTRNVCNVLYIIYIYM